MPPSPILFFFLTSLTSSLFPTSASPLFPLLPHLLSPSPTHRQPRNPPRFRHQSRTCAAPAPSPDAVECIRQALPCCTPFQLLQPLQPCRLSAAHQLRPPRITRQSVAQLADCEAIRKSRAPGSTRHVSTPASGHSRNVTLSAHHRPPVKGRSLVDAPCLSFSQGCRFCIQSRSCASCLVFVGPFAGFYFCSILLSTHLFSPLSLFPFPLLPRSFVSLGILVML